MTTEEIKKIRRWAFYMKGKRAMNKYLRDGDSEDREAFARDWALARTKMLALCKELLKSSERRSDA